MLTILYFLLLLAASAEDVRHHMVRPVWIAAVGILGLLNCIAKENRWVTLALTCACFMLLYLLYKLTVYLAVRYHLPYVFGGADVKLIPGMMLMQGWDIALSGIFAGLLMALVYYWIIRRQKKEIPLVPWMSAGCLLAELFL